MVVAAPLQRVWGTPRTELAHLMSLCLMAPMILWEGLKCLQRKDSKWSG
jgi:hypothetical protein